MDTKGPLEAGYISEKEGILKTPSSIQDPCPPYQPSAYKPQVGFTELPHRFHMWSRIASVSFAATVEFGPVPLGNVLYLAKERALTSGKTTYKDTSGRILGEAHPKKFFSAKHNHVLSFNGYQSDMTRSGDSHSFTAPVNGSVNLFEWRKSSHMALKLIPKGAPPHAEPLATWEAHSDRIDADRDLGIFQFHGAVLTGARGDDFMAIAIMSIARIYLTEYEQTVAATRGILVDGTFGSDV